MITALGNHLWQSTLFCGLVALLMRTLQGNRAAVRHGLWLAASLKFLVPFSLLVAIAGHVEWRNPPAAVRPPLLVVDQISRPFVTHAPASLPVSTPAAPDRLRGVLFAVWLCGFASQCLAWWRRWRQIRAAVRWALPLPLRLPIRAISTRSRLEPGVFGIFRPVLVLPEGIGEYLTTDQLESIVAHELCHVRRHDNLAAAFHMVVEAIFWFHPAVWWIGERMAEERERACDEEVLRAGRDPEDYADGILKVCKLYLRPPLVCMSGVAGPNLKKRIEAIMTDRVVSNLDFGKKVLLAGAGLAALSIPLFIGALSAPPVRAQSQPGQHLAFEVASVKANNSADRNWERWEYLPDGGLTAENTVLYGYIATAYNLPFQSVRLSGGPAWIRSERYDIQAKAQKGTIPPGLSPVSRKARTNLMLQSLLADRFHLKIRRETREVPVYALLVARNGLKLKKAATEEKDCSTEGNTDGVACHELNGGQGRGLHGQAVTMTDIVDFVSNWTDRPFVDKTDLPGLYAIDTVGWVPLRNRPAPPPGTDPTAEDIAYADPITPTLFTVFDRVGLKIEQQKASIEMFVIESVERPTGN